jgi:hypothetical protein
MDLKQSETAKRLQAGSSAKRHKGTHYLIRALIFDSNPPVLSHFQTQQLNQLP